MKADVLLIWRFLINDNWYRYDERREMEYIYP